MKRLILLTLALVMVATLFTSCDKKKIDDDDDDNDSETVSSHKAPAFDDIDLSPIADLTNVTVTEEETDYVLLEVEGHGKILIRLFPDVAPITVANFKKLVKQHFYDGIIFHRVIKDFMIQGGDPDGTGTGSSSDTIKGEFAANAFTNNLRHVRGVVSMARTKIPDSASSQFFIMHKDTPSLNGQYAAFGYVVYGMDAVDSIANVATNPKNDKPLENVTITSARFAKIG